jgi:hypothetical protein
MAFRLTRVDRKEITKQFAQEFAGLTQLDRERSRKSSRLTQLDRLIRLGKIKAFNWAVGCYGGTHYRVNGGHTSYLFTVDTPIPPGATAIVEYYDCDTLDDVAALWSSFDSQLSSRTSNENISIFSSTRDGLKGVSPRVLSLALSAVSFDHWGNNFQFKAPRLERYELLDQHSPFVRWLADLRLTESSRNFLGRVGVVYAMLKTWQISPPAALAFWTEVGQGVTVDDEPIHPRSPTGQLRTYLLSTDVNNGVGSKTSRPKASFEAMAKRCILVWNHWRRGLSELKLLKQVKAMPEAI